MYSNVKFYRLFEADPQIKFSSKAFIRIVNMENNKSLEIIQLALFP